MPRTSMTENAAVFLTGSSFGLMMLALAGGAAGAQVESPPEDRPNIILILADDHSYRDFGFMGNDLVATPRIDALARGGVVYPRGYVSASFCRPSLASLLTGLYPHQHGIHFNHPPPGLAAMREMAGEDYHRTRSRAEYLIQGVPTLPRLLSEHGYACLQTGKHWEGGYATAGFSQGMTRGRPAPAAFEEDAELLGIRRQENGDWVAHGNGDAGLSIGRQTMEPIYAFIDERASFPFFVWYAPFLPHTPYDAGPRFHEPYATVDLPAHLRDYYAEIYRFDETVGQLIDFLRDRSLIENTLIVLASDNGFRPRRERPTAPDSRSKWSPYEDGIRTPVVFYHEGILPAEERPEIVQTIDLVPTLLSLAGLEDEITTDMQGRRLLAAAAAAPDHRPAAFGAVFPNDARTLGEPSRHVEARWIREDDWKLIAWEARDAARRTELYDVRRDPEERVDLSGTPEFEHVVAHLLRRLDGWWTPGDDAVPGHPPPGSGNRAP